MRVSLLYNKLPSRMRRMLLASEYVHIYRTNTSKYGVGVLVDTAHYVRQGILDTIMKNYADKISQAVKNIRKK